MINKSVFEGIIDGKTIQLFTLENNNGLKANFTNYGARLVNLKVPSPAGNLISVIAGFDTLDEYLHSTEIYCGAVIGRYCNRITNARFNLEGKTYCLSANDGRNSLHGGICGFHSVIWDFVQQDSNSLIFSYLSKDMEEGYPGNLL